MIALYVEPARARTRTGNRPCVPNRLLNPLSYAGIEPRRSVRQDPLRGSQVICISPRPLLSLRVAIPGPLAISPAVNPPRDTPSAWINRRIGVAMATMAAERTEGGIGDGH